MKSIKAPVLRWFCTIMLIMSHLLVGGQALHLTSFQHNIRWLDEVRFPPLVTRPSVEETLLDFAAYALAQKFHADSMSRPTRIEYKNIVMFGKPKLTEPAPSSNPNDYQASVLSFITRATTGLEVLWSIKAEVRQNGKTIFSREINHELLHYADSIEWFTDDSFVETFQKLFDELLENTPPLAYKYALGAGINSDSLLRAHSEAWAVDRNHNPLGFAKPNFGPYTTLQAEKLDTAVIRTRTKLGTTYNVGVAGSHLFLDQYKVIDYNKTKFCEMVLANGPDTMHSLFAVGTLSREAKRTIAGQIFSGNSGEDRQILLYKRNVSGNIVADSVEWDFFMENYNPDGTFSRAYLTSNTDEYIMENVIHAGYRREIVLKDRKGEYFASMVFSFSNTKFLLRQDLHPSVQHAIAALYAIYLSVRNLP